MPIDRDRRAAEIFADALELPPEARAGCIERACEGDEGLRAEVESLLRAHPGARALFDRPVRVDPWAGSPEAWMGRRIGAYRLIKHIATGGMGAVFIGERTDREFEARVAVKLIRSGMDTSEVLSRFRSERQILANLQHPHIAHLLDGGSTDEGLPYIIMEYVDGIPIDEYCNHHRLSVPSRVRLFLQVCEAIQHAHQNLVIHRDLKPSNILVDRRGHARVIDFGIAKVLESPGADSACGTATVLRALTPRYASPEQIRGGRATTSADVYSLGVILFVLLTGTFPYNLAGRTGSEIEMAVCEQTPIGPSRAVAPTRRTVNGRTRDDNVQTVLDAESEASSLRATTPRGLRRQLYGDLDTILLKALSKEPERRYTSVDAFAADLKRHLDGRPVLARPDSATYRVARVVRRNKAIAASVLSVVLILAAALVITVSLYHRERDRAHEAEQLAYTSSVESGESLLLLAQVAEARRRLDAAPPSIRGWEWWHLRGRLDRSLSRWPGHERQILDCALTPDARVLATCSSDSTVKLWDVRSGRLRRSWGPLSGSIESVAVNPVDTSVVAGLADGSVLILAPGVDTIRGFHPPDIPAGPRSWALVDVRSDGARVAAGFMNGALIEWDYASGRQLAEWRAHSSLAHPVYSPSGRFLASGGAEGTLRVWDSDSHALVQELHGHTQRLFSVAFDSEEHLIATGSVDRTANVWDWRSGQLKRTFQGHRGTVTNLCFIPGTRLLASTSADGTFLRWNAEKGYVLGAYLGHEADVGGIAMSGSGELMVSTDWAGWVRTWSPLAEDVRALQVPRLGGRLPAITDVAHDGGSGWIACATIADHVAVWNVVEPDSTCRMISIGTTRRLAFTASGSEILCATDQGSLCRLHVASGEVGLRHQAHRGPILSMERFADGRQVITSSRDSFLRIWKTSDLSLVREISTSCSEVEDLEVTADSSRIALAGTDGSIRICRFEDGIELRRVAAHSGPVRDVAFSPDGNRIASASDDGSALIWDSSRGEILATMLTGGAPVWAIAWSADGARIAAGSSEGLVRIFDGCTGRAIVSLHGHYSGVTSLEFARDDQWLISGSRDGSVRIWESDRPRP